MQKEVQKKYIELQLLNQEIKKVQEQFVFLQQQLTELSSLEISITDLKYIKKDSEIFSSIGSGIFVNSKLSSIQNVLVNIGAGVLIEKSLEDALKLIKTQIDNVNNSVESLKEQLNKALVYNEKLTQELNEIISREEKGKAA